MMFSKKLRTLCLVLVLTLTLASLSTAFASVQDYTPSSNDWDMTYAELLRLYVSCINSWIAGSCQDHDLFNTLLVEDFSSYGQAKTQAGFVMTDVNADGVYELLIISEEDEVVGLFTRVNGKLREVIAGGYRNQCSLLSDGSFYLQESNGYLQEGYSRWYLRTVGKLWFDNGYLLDGWFGTEEPSGEQWFRYNPASPYAGSEDRRVSASEAAAWKNATGGCVIRVNNWTSFADYEAAGCPDDLPYTPFSALR